MKFWLLAVAVLICSLPELWLGAFGFILPLTLIPVFFAAVSYGWFAGALCALCTGIWLDLIFGRAFPVSVPALMLGVVNCYLWLKNRGIPDLPDAIVPSCIFSASAEFIWTVGLEWGDSFSAKVFFQAAGFFLWQGALGAVICFAGFCLVTVCAERLGVPAAAANPVKKQRRTGHGRRWSPEGNLR